MLKTLQTRNQIPLLPLPEIKRRCGTVGEIDWSISEFESWFISVFQFDEPQTEADKDSFWSTSVDLEDYSLHSKGDVCLKQDLGVLEDKSDKSGGEGGCLWYICRPVNLFWVRCSQEEAADQCAGRVVHHRAFEPVIISAILVNTIFMAMPHGGQSDSWINMLDAAEVSFTVIFVFEAILKITGLGGFKHYISEPMNIFDFSLVILSLGSSVVTVTGLRGLRTLKILRMLRSMRALRMLRVMSRIQRLYIVFAGSGVAILTQLAFIIYIVCIMALVGMQCFDQTDRDDEPLGRTLNFDTFGNAVLALFVGLTGEWPDIMIGCGEIEPTLAIPFWIIFIMLVNLTLVEMVTAVVVEKFEISEEHRETLQEKIHVMTHSTVTTTDSTRKESLSKLDKTAVNLSKVQRDVDQGEEAPISELVSKMRQMDIFAHEQVSNFVCERADSIGAAVYKAWLHDVTGNLCGYGFYIFVLAFKRSKRKSVQANLYVEKSLYIFDIQNPIRRCCQLVSRHDAFEWFLFVTITASCVMLALGLR